MKNTHNKPNEQLFPKQVDMQLPKFKTAETSMFLPIFVLKLQNNKIESRMGSFYSGNSLLMTIYTGTK